MNDSLVSLRAVSKTFDAVRALDDVSLELRAGEIHGLLGQNGSGKSTLVKILTGYHTPDAGAEGTLLGKPLTFPVRNAGHRGIAVIHQDLALVENLTVTDNVGLVDRFGAARGTPVRAGRERRRLNQLQQRLGLDLDPDAPVSSLSAAERAFVGILRAMRQMQSETRTPVFILDEPTAYLTHTESRKVIDLMRDVCRLGGAALFITHDLGEALTTCDRLTVLVGGRREALLTPADTTHAELVSLLLGGRVLPHRAALEAARPGPVRLRLSDLRSDVLNGFSADICAGEVVGVIGLAGMGQDELPYMIAGHRRPISGSIEFRLEGAVAASSTRGVALVPANRARDGLWLEATAEENIALPRLKRYRSAVGGIRDRAVRGDAQRLLEQFGVKPTRFDLAGRKFSGGNQQKILLAKWMQDAPQVLVMHEPTQGVDVGARADISTIVRRAAADGAAVLICSTDHEELAQVCDRVIIVRHGRQVGELTGADVEESMILSAVS